MHERAPSPDPSPQPGPLPLETALAFFREFYRGEHHIPNGGIRRGSDGVKRHGTGWCVIDDTDLSSWDFDELTRLLFLAHDMCVRVSVMPQRGSKLKIAIWARLREGSMSTRHPTLEQAVEAWRARHPIVDGGAS